VKRLLLAVGLSASLALVWGVGCDYSADKCISEWNAPTNAMNRTVVAQSGQRWRVEVRRWTVDHPAEDLDIDWCSYFFYTDARWMSFSGAWEKDGDLRWGVPANQRGPRTPEQQIGEPNAVVQPDGTFVIVSERAALREGGGGLGVSALSVRRAGVQSVRETPADRLALFGSCGNGDSCCHRRFS
jgi:hypothetical protein